MVFPLSTLAESGTAGLWGIHFSYLQERESIPFREGYIFKKLLLCSNGRVGKNSFLCWGGGFSTFPEPTAKQ